MRSSLEATREIDAMGNLAVTWRICPVGALLTISSDSFDLAPAAASEDSELSSTKDVLEKFDKNVAATRSAIAGLADPDLFKSWTLMSNGNTILTMPKSQCCAAS